MKILHVFSESFSQNYNNKKSSIKMQRQQGYTKTVTIILLTIVIGLFVYLFVTGELKISFN